MGRLLDIVAALRSGERSLDEVIDDACAGIDARDGKLRAFLPEPERRARLRREAEAMRGRAPLFGAPVAIKDIIRIEGLPVAAGSEAPLDFEGPEAACVARLRAAGATILGRTATTEFAWMEPAPTRNPLDPTRTPGGSSSGSAAAVAAGLAPLALGSQTIGSTIRPAAFCGIVGFKPSHARIPLDGVFPAAPSADTVGLFTSDAVDMMLAAAVLLTGWRPAEAPESVRVGVPEGAWLEQAGARARDSFARSLAAASIAVVPVPIGAQLLAASGRHARLVAAEFARAHAERYRRHVSLLRPRTRELIEAGRTIGDDELEQLRASGLALRETLHARMEALGLDGWASPAALGPAPRGLESTGSPALNAPWTHAGLPVVTVPMGTLEGMPLGLQFAGRHGADERLLELARWTERVSREGPP